MANIIGLRTNTHTHVHMATQERVSPCSLVTNESWSTCTAAMKTSLYLLSSFRFATAVCLLTRPLLHEEGSEKKTLSLCVCVCCYMRTHAFYLHWGAASPIVQGSLTKSTMVFTSTTISFAQRVNPYNHLTR